MISQNTLFAVAAVVMLVAALSLGFTYYSVMGFKQGFLTGHVTANGTIYINITSSVAINFTTSVINWRNGSVNPSTTFANLSTSLGTVVGGSWIPVSQGLVLENIGGVNVSVSVMSGKTNATFIGGTNPYYRYNVSNIEAGSCTAASGFTLSTFYDVNNTTPGTYVCSNFSFLSSKDSLEIDIALGIPYDAPALSVNLTDQIMVTALQSASATGG